MRRSAACVALLAAVLQADAPGGGGFGAPQAGPLLPHAWAYLARLLNKLQPTPQVAAALEAFLEMARRPPPAPTNVEPLALF